MTGKENNKNSKFQKLDILTGKWSLTLTNAWFLDSLETKVSGKASFEWIENAFLLSRRSISFEDIPDSSSVIGYSSPANKFEVFYHDIRGVSRIFDMEFDGERWTMLRQDSDFYQRFNAEINGDTITAATYASDDKGKTWRKDFDILFTKQK